MLGFLRQSSRLKDKRYAALVRARARARERTHSRDGRSAARRLEALEAKRRELHTHYEQARGALAAQQKRAGRFGDRAVRLESLDARHKASLASAHRELAKARRECEQLREQLEGEIHSAAAAREALIVAQEQLRIHAARRQAERAFGDHAQLSAENRAMRARVHQLARAMERAMMREDVVLRAGGGYVTLPKYLQRLMMQSAPPAEPEPAGAGPDEGDASAEAAAAVAAASEAGRRAAVSAGAAAGGFDGDGGRRTDRAAVIRCEGRGP